MRTKLSTTRISALSAIPRVSSPAVLPHQMCRVTDDGAGQRPAGKQVQCSCRPSRSARHAPSVAGRSDRSAIRQVAETAAQWRGPRRVPLAHRWVRGTRSHSPKHASPEQPGSRSTLTGSLNLGRAVAGK